MKRVLFFLLLISWFFMLFLTQAYRISPRKEIPPFITEALHKLAMQGLSGGEVPVGAVLVYGDSIIGAGYNTVVLDTLLSGHAEMNAINEAHRRNRAAWKSFDHSQMTLYSTYEPCEMCKGAMINLNIGYAVFEGPKPLTDRLKTTLKTWYYELKKRRFNAPGMQERLFQQHPDYKNR